MSAKPFAAALRSRLKVWLTPRRTVRLRCLIRGKELPSWGNLRRTRPFSESFGADRGTPVDRYYLHRFLEAHSAEIIGDVLEIQLPDYTRRYGREVTASHTLDIEARFHPTYLCDLAAADGVVPTESYDCFLLPNTLSFLRDLEGCLSQALRVTKPGGVILAATASLGPLIPDGPDYWRMSAAGWNEVARRVWPECEVTVESHGNCLSAAAAMLGLAHEELAPEELDVNDPRYPVLVTVHCRKPER